MNLHPLEKCLAPDVNFQSDRHYYFVVGLLLLSYEWAKGQSPKTCFLEK